MMRRPISATAFAREILAVPGVELFSLERDAIDPGDPQQHVYTRPSGFFRVPESQRPLEILADEGRSWLAFQYFEKTQRVASSRLILDVARTLDAIAVFRKSETRS